MGIIYISEKGSDVWGEGTIKNPYASFQKGMEMVRREKGERVLCVREGRYVFKEPLLLSEQDSNCRIAAFPGEKVILSGAEKMSALNWRQDPENPKIQNAFIGKGLWIDQIYIDGRLQIMARYPDYQEGVLPLGGVVDENQIKARSVRWSRPETGYLRALHEAGWGGNDYYIRGKNDTSPLGLKIQWNGDNNRGHLYKKDALVAENIREELDCEREWFYDRETGILSFMPEAGTIPDLSTEVEASVNTEIFRLCGTDVHNPVRNLQISGFTIEKTGRTLFTTEIPGKEYISLLRGDWAVVRSGSIYLENAEDIVIENCSFENIGGNAIFAWGYHAGHKIQNNEMCHIGASAIQLVGSPSAVCDPSYWEHLYYPEHIVHETTVKHPEIQGPVSEEYPRDIEIRENHIYDIGIYEKQSSGVNLSVSSRIRILHNTIHKSARSDININDGSFGGHEIAYNDIYDSQRETTDHGPFNSWGRDRFWSVPEYNGAGLNGQVVRHYNKDGKEYDVALLDAYQTTRIHHNRFHHSSKETHSWGIDLDDGSSNYEISENLCLGVGIKLREGFERRVHNNIIVDGQMQIHCTFYEAEDAIYENLFINKIPWGFAGLGENETERLKQGKMYIDRNAYFCFDGEVELPEYWEELKFDRESVRNIDPVFENPESNEYFITSEILAKKMNFTTFKVVYYGKKNCKLQPSIYHIKRNYKKENLCRTSWKGAIISNINYAIMSSTGTAGTKGVYFQKVPVDCEAYRLGYRTHQVLKQWNGTEIHTVKEFLKFSKEQTGCTEIKFDQKKNRGKL